MLRALPGAGWVWGVGWGRRGRCCIPIAAYPSGAFPHVCCLPRRLCRQATRRTDSATIKCVAGVARLGWACAAGMLHVCWDYAVKMLPDKDNCHVRYGAVFTERGGASRHKIWEPGMRLLPDGVVAPGRGFEPRLTDPEPAIRGGEMPTLMVSGLVPLALLQLSRLSSLFGKLLQARQNEM